MTFRELLNKVRFEDVAPHLVRMYPDMKNCLGWFKIHFDMLCHMTPKYHDDAGYKTCNITQKDWGDWTGSHLDASSMEGDLWEHSLTKELVIAPDVMVSDEEIAACCLWHTSFYGFVQKELDEMFEDFSDKNDSKSLAMKNYGIIRKHGGIIPTVRELSKLRKQELIKRAKTATISSYRRMNKIKRKKQFRQVFMSHYYERMEHISNYVVQAIPALDNRKNYLTTKQLCGLFQAEKFCSEEIMSYADKEESGTSYLLDVISKYNMVPQMDGIVIHLITGIEHDILTEDEQCLCYYLSKRRKYSDLITSTDTSLGNQVIIRYAAYDSNTKILS